MTVALASCTDGKWKLLDVIPERAVREKATVNSVSSLTIDIVLKFSRKGFPEV
jgi:hypothetical protein